MFTTSNQQIFSIGGGYLAEHHSEANQRYLPPSDTESLFDEILKSLRSALSCCGKQRASEI
jgi:hypothetical protein